MLSTARAALGGLLVLSSLPSALSRHLEAVSSDEHRHQRLAVILPMPQSGWHDGQWPTGCSSGKTTQKVDLVLYVSRQKGVAGVGARPPHLPHNHCFARVHAVYGPEAHPDNPSSDMLYNTFLDKGVHSQLSQYDALAAIPSWDDTATATAKDFSADMLYDLAFPQHDSEDKFWVKTMTLGGGSKKLRGDDSLNTGDEGASIYNNDDSEFADFVRVTHELQPGFQQRWGMSALLSFDEALSFALKNPQYNEYAPMFVTAGVVLESGGVDDEHAHASATRTSKLQPWKENKKGNGTEQRKLQTWRAQQKYKGLKKWAGDSDDGVEPKWKTQQKWKGDPENGVLPKWQVEKKWKTKYCDPECTRTSKDGTKGRVCDSSCESGEPYGKKGCSAKNGKYGMFCRMCYNDIGKAQRNDRPGDRAIMCDTLEPPSVYSKRGLVAEETPDHHAELASQLMTFKRGDTPT